MFSRLRGHLPKKTELWLRARRLSLAVQLAAPGIVRQEQGLASNGKKDVVYPRICGRATR